MLLKEQHIWKITIAFSVIAALLGLLLRFYFVSPMSFNFRNVLHAHSHLMLLGWLFNALLLLIYHQWQIKIPKSHKRLFMAMAICVAGMLFSFPVQGYAFVSITFSTLHLWLSYILLIKLWKLSKGRGISGKLVKWGILFFFLSTIGPYSLGPMMANEMQGSPWYDQAIFFYLHFQYNGAFLFFMLAFMLEKWTNKLLFINEKLFLFLIIGGVILTWFHSLDYSFDALWINLLGGSGAVLQLAAVLMLLKVMDYKNLVVNQYLILIMFCSKLLFQLFGSLPAIADMAVNNRFFLIAFLHFIFLGIFTPFIWSYFQTSTSGLKIYIRSYWFFFFLTEAVLIAPFLLTGFTFSHWPFLTFILYTLLVISWIVISVKLYFSSQLNRKRIKL